MPATITYWVLAEGLMAAVLSDTLTQSAPRSTAAELRFCSTTRYQVRLNFQLELALGSRDRATITGSGRNERLAGCCRAVTVIIQVTSSLSLAAARAEPAP